MTGNGSVVLQVKDETTLTGFGLGDNPFSESRKGDVLSFRKRVLKVRARMLALQTLTAAKKRCSPARPAGAPPCPFPQILSARNSRVGPERLHRNDVTPFSRPKAAPHSPGFQTGISPQICALSAHHSGCVRQA